MITAVSFATSSNTVVIALESSSFSRKLPGTTVMGSSSLNISSSEISAEIFSIDFVDFKCNVTSSDLITAVSFVTSSNTVVIALESSSFFRRHSGTSAKGDIALNKSSLEISSENLSVDFWDFKCNIASFDLITTASFATSSNTVFIISESSSSLIKHSEASDNQLGLSCIHDSTSWADGRLLFESWNSFCSLRKLFLCSGKVMDENGLSSVTVIFSFVRFSSWFKLFLPEFFFPSVSNDECSFDSSIVVITLWGVEGTFILSDISRSNIPKCKEEIEFSIILFSISSVSFALEPTLVESISWILILLSLIIVVIFGWHLGEILKLSSLTSFVWILIVESISSMIIVLFSEILCSSGWPLGKLSTLTSSISSMWV